MLANSSEKVSAGAQGASARGINHLSGYRKFLLYLSRDLSIKDLEELKFACSDDVPLGKREEVTAGFMLFDILEQKGRITPQNLTFLEDMMFTIERNDLGLEVNRFMKDKRKEMKFDGMETILYISFNLLYTLITFILNI